MLVPPHSRRRDDSSLPAATVSAGTLSRMIARRWAVGAALLAAALALASYFALGRTDDDPTIQNASPNGTSIVTATPDTPPFTVRSGPAQGNLRIPNVDNITPVGTTPDSLKALEPRVAILADVDAVRFQLGGARLWKTPSGQFSAEIRYRSSERNEELLIGSWTPAGSVDLVLPLSSPVRNIVQRKVAGMDAVLLLQAEGVQGKPGHNAYLASGGTFYQIELQGTGGPGANDDFVAMLTRIAESLPK